MVQQVPGAENAEQDQLYFSALSGSGKLGVTEISAQNKDSKQPHTLFKRKVLFCGSKQPQSFFFKADAWIFGGRSEN